MTIGRARPQGSDALRLGLRKVCTAASIFFAWLAKKVYRSPQEKEVDRWFSDEGDRTLRVQYDLTPDSIVLDLGGYRGDWAAEITARYGCRVIVFEPVPTFAENIRRRFAANNLIEVHPFGLGAEAAIHDIRLAEEGSSLFESPNVPHESTDLRIRIERADQFFSARRLRDIDLMKINIEGGEYDLLDHLLETNIIRQIKNIQVQFHDFVPRAPERMCAIQKGLAATHSLTYQYPFVWENWTKKDS